MNGVLEKQVTYWNRAASVWKGDGVKEKRNGVPWRSAYERD